LYVDVGDEGYFVEEATDSLGWLHLIKTSPVTLWPSIRADVSCGQEDFNEVN